MSTTHAEPGESSGVRNGPTPAGVRVGVYERTVAASEERVWENVRDWEHLPWLHAGSFAAIECLDAGRWGWRARIGVGDGAQPILLELVIDPDAPRYVSRTLAGPGAGTEIWTTVTARGADTTDVRVEFWVPDVPADAASRVGAGFVALYTRLWDEDEAMMVERARALAARGQRVTPTPDAPRSLGRRAALALPSVFAFGGRSFRLVEDTGELVAHALECPHWLGPLDAADVEAGRVVCPWHGYAFDLRTGKECTGRRLRLAPAPSVRVDPETDEVWVGG